MKNTIIITSVLFVAVVVASIFYFTDLSQGDQSKRKPFTHIPEDAVYVVSFRNDKVVDDIFAGFELFRAMLGNDHFRRLLYLRTNLLRDERISPYTDGQEVLLSFHPTATHIDYLMVIPSTKKLTLEALYEEITTIDTAYQLQWPDSAHRSLLQIQLPDGMPPLFISQQKGILLASFTKELVDRAIDDTVPKLPDEAITHFIDESSGNTPLSLYANNDHLFTFAATLMGSKPGNFIGLLQELTGYSALHMNFKSDALMFSGNSLLDTDTTNYLSLYSKQQPIELTLRNTFPNQTAIYASFGIADYPLLHRGITTLLEKRGAINQMREQHRLIQQSSGLSVQDELLPQWGDEFAVLELANREQLAIIKVKDSLSFANTIQRISTAYPQNMYRLNHSNLLYYSFGDPLQSFTRPYFLLIDDFFVCANHTSTLRRFETGYAEQKTLATTLGYIDFDRLQANKANISVFVNQENAARTIASALKTPYQSTYSDERHFGYQQFYAWSFQLSGASEGFFANLYAKYTNQDSPGTTPEWTFNLNGRLISTPAVLHYNDTSRFILAQASNHILYALSPDGKQLWNAQLPGPILGNIHQLADRSILLTTAKRLYRFDTDGDPLPGFSLTLPHDATYGATVYENGQDIRLFVPAGNRILAYDTQAKTLPGWENKSINGDILFDIKTAYLDDINYVVAITDAGRCYFFNYNGSLVRMVDTKIGNGFQNPMGIHTVSDDADASWVITSDTTGTLITTPFRQDPIAEEIASWTASHTFDVANITNGSTPDLVFTDHGQLSVYRYHDRGLVYHYDFGQPIAGRPQFFQNPNGTQQIGIATEGNHLLYVFNTDGTVVEGFPTEGNPGFYYGNLHPDGRRYLICSKNDRRLHVYRY